ncbi:MAG: glycoside hydrolase family 31 protein [Bacteroidales bacterium]
MPKWAMGFWQSRERYKTQDEILGTVREFRKDKFLLTLSSTGNTGPIDKWGDHDFDSTCFADPKSMLTTLSHDSLNARLISVWGQVLQRHQEL